MKLTNLQHEADKIRMTAQEKAAMQSRLFGMPSPLAPSRVEGYFVFNFQFAMRAVAAVLAFLVVGGGGVAYAAQGSLPGQALYSVKINVEEPIQVALAPTPEAKAVVYAQLAQTRVQEAQALAARGDLDATTTAQLAQNFDSQVANARVLATQVAATDPAAATDITQSLSASLETNGAILAEVGSESTSTHMQSDKFAAQVIASAQGVAGAATSSPAASARARAAFAIPRAIDVSGDVSGTAASGTAEMIGPAAALPPAGAQTESSSSDEEGAQTAAPAPHLLQSAAAPTASSTAELEIRAQAALDAAQQSYDSAKASLDANSAAALDARFARAQAEMSDGSTALGDDEYAAAQADFIKALRGAAMLQTLLQAHQNLGPAIIPLLDLKATVGVSASAVISQ